MSFISNRKTNQRTPLEAKRKLSTTNHQNGKCAQLDYQSFNDYIIIGDFVFKMCKIIQHIAVKQYLHSCRFQLYLAPQSIHLSVLPQNPQF